MRTMMPVAVCGEGVVGAEEQLASHTNAQAEEDLAKDFSGNNIYTVKKTHSNGQAEQDLKRF